MDFAYVQDGTKLRTLVAEVMSSPEVALDTETTRARGPEGAYFENIYNEAKDGYGAFDAYTSEVRLVQLRGRHTEPVVVDLWALAPDDKQWLAEALEAYAGVYIVHNWRFDAKHVFKTLGVWLDANAKTFCTMQASILMANSTGTSRGERGHRLVDCARDFLSVDLDKTEQSSDWGQVGLSAEQLEYAALDVVHLHELYDFMKGALTNPRTYNQQEPMELDMAVLGPTARMEHAGMPFCPKYYQWAQEAAAKNLPQLIEAFGIVIGQELVKHGIDIGYVPQVFKVPDAKGREMLVTATVPTYGGKVGPELIRANQKLLALFKEIEDLQDEDGNALSSTQKAILEPFIKDYPFLDLLIKYKDLEKQSQFKLIKYVHPLTKRIHSKFQPGGASTGRYSCVAADTMVTTTKGLRRIDQLVPGEVAVTSKGNFPISHVWCSGTKQLYKVTLNDGRVIRTTADHRFLSGSGSTWTELRDLRPGDNVFLSLNGASEHEPVSIRSFYQDDIDVRTPHKFPAELSVELCEFLGLALADGCIRPRQRRAGGKYGVEGKKAIGRQARYDQVALAFHWDDGDQAEKIATYCESLFGRPFVIRKTHTALCGFLSSTRVAESLAALGLEGKAHTKRIPDVVMTSPPKYAAAFLRGLFEGDGCHSKTGAVSLKSVNVEMLRQAQTLLGALGIYGTISACRDTSGFVGSQRWMLTLSGRNNLQRYRNTVGFMSARKSAARGTEAVRLSGVVTPIKVRGGELREQALAAGLIRRGTEACRQFVPLYQDKHLTEGCLADLLRRFGELPALEEGARYLERKLKVQTIRSIEVDCIEEVWDISVPGADEFLGNGLVIHNCQAPNLQQIPAKFELIHPNGLKLTYRDVFSTRGTHLLVSASDFSSQELLVMAKLSGDPIMLQALNEGADLHSEIAAGMFGIDPKDARSKKPGSDKTYRDYGKILCYCVAGSVRVASKRGYVPIADLKVGDWVHSGTDWRQVTNHWSSGVKKVVTLRTGLGYRIEVTPEHRMQVMDADGVLTFRRVKDLKQSDLLVIAPETEAAGDATFPTFACEGQTSFKDTPLPSAWTPELARFLGYFVSEGCSRRGGTSYCASYSQALGPIQEDMRHVAQVVLGDWVSLTSINLGGKYLPQELVTFSRKAVFEWLEAIGAGGNAATKRVPWVVFESPVWAQEQFLAGLWAGDGSVVKNGGHGYAVSYISKSKELCEDVMALLLNLGIPSQLRPVVFKDYPDNTYWTIRVRDYEAFLRRVSVPVKTDGLAGLKKVADTLFIPNQQERLRVIQPLLEGKLDQVRYIAGRPYSRTHKEKLYECVRPKNPVGLNRARLTMVASESQLAGVPEWDHLKDLHARGWLYDTWTIEDEGREVETFDITVDTDHVFVAQGLVTHNSLAYGKTEQGFATQWKMTVEEVKVLIEGFKGRFKKLAAFLDRAGTLGKTRNYSRLANGAVRFVGGSGSASGAQRQAANYQIQGLSAWSTRVAMIVGDELIRKSGRNIQLNAQIHDEILWVHEVHDLCPYGTFCKEQDPEQVRLTKEFKAWSAGKDKDEVKAAKEALGKALAARERETREACARECGNHRPCATWTEENIIVPAMTAGAEYALKGVVRPPEGYSSCGTRQYWVK